MRLLLDTHALLWFVMEDPRLTETARIGMSERQNQKLVSLASLWEIAIKYSLGKLDLTMPLSEFIPTHLTPEKVQLLQITVPHLLTVASLPHHHRDPFDRLLIAQALTEDVPIVSHDDHFDAYGVQRLW
jgi:PIN domain nuclease of toxin-antitoxin system